MFNLQTNQMQDIVTKFSGKNDELIADWVNANEQLFAE